MKKILSAIFILVISGCLLPSFAKKDEQAVITPQTQLQKRQYQTKQYSNVKKDVLMKAMLNVLQDEGFIVNNANPTLGFISGAKEFSTNPTPKESIPLAKELKELNTFNGAKEENPSFSLLIVSLGPKTRLEPLFNASQPIILPSSKIDCSSQLVSKIE